LLLLVLLLFPDHLVNRVGAESGERDCGHFE
jgi:hypothetical protein